MILQTAIFVYYVNELYKILKEFILMVHRTSKYKLGPEIGSFILIYLIGTFETFVSS